MNPMKMKLIEELMSHLDSSQGGDLKSMMDMDKNKAGVGADPLGEEEEMDEMGKPKGIMVKKVSIMGKKPEMEEGSLGKMGHEMNDVAGVGESPEEEMSDDELSELLKKVLS